MGEQRKDGKMLFGCIHLVFLQELFRATGEFVNSCFFVAWSFCLAFGFLCKVGFRILHHARKSMN